MTDPLTGIHEPTVVIPWWLDCRNYKPPIISPPEWFRNVMTDYWKSVKENK